MMREKRWEFVLICVFRILVFAALTWCSTYAQESNIDKKRDTTSDKSASLTNKPNPLPSITAWQSFQAKISLWRGERWGLPIRIGDTRYHVYEVLGNPASNTEPKITQLQHLAKTWDAEQDVQYWPEKGLSVTFKKDTVASIYAASSDANAVAKSAYKGELVYGIHPGDNLSTLFSHLGPPFESDPVWGYVWRFGNYEIDQTVVSKSENSDGKQYAPGDAWGGITITDIRPKLKEEEDAKLEKERITLTGKALTPQVIYEKYKNRIFIVTSLNSHNEAIAVGTGFQFRDDLIVTNYRIVQDARKIVVKSIAEMDQPVKFYVACLSTQPADDAGTKFLGSRSNDWAILRPSGETKIKMLPPVETKRTPSIGEEIVVGNPEGVDGSVTTGMVTAIRSDHWMQISTPISRTSSGSPVFDNAGKWLGLATLTPTEGQNQNFAIPSDNIVGKIQQLTVPKLGDRIFFSMAIMPLRSKSFDPVYRTMIARDDKILSEARASIDDIEKLLQKYQDPEDQDSLLSSLTRIYSESLHDLQSALAVANKRIQIEGGHYGAWEDQGLVLAKLGNREEANKSFSHAIELAQAEISSEMEKNKKDFDKAEYEGESNSTRELNKKIFDDANNRCKQSHATDALEIGRMYLLMGKTDESRKWLNTAKEWDVQGYFSKPEAERLLGIIDQATTQKKSPLR